MKKTYDIIYSIGDKCPCAMYQIKAGLRSCSGPFDWLANADMVRRVETIESGFAGFLEKEDLELSPLTAVAATGNPDVIHDIYFNRRTTFHFYHDFPQGVPLDECFDEVKRKYARRIERFMELIRTRERVLLMWFSLTRGTPDATILSCAERLCRFFGKRVDLVVIEHADGIKTSVTRPADNVEIWRGPFKSIGADGQETLLGRGKLILPIFRRYTLPVPLSARLGRTARKLAVNIACLFLPVKSWRRRLRACYKPDAKQGVGS